MNYYANLAALDCHPNQLSEIISSKVGFSAENDKQLVDAAFLSQKLNKYFASDGSYQA